MSVKNYLEDYQREGFDISVMQEKIHHYYVVEKSPDAIFISVMEVKKDAEKSIQLAEKFSINSNHGGDF